VGAKLTLADEGMHTVGEAKNWNESTYVDLFDPVLRVGAWFRLGNRPNERYSEMSACVNLPDGRDTFFFERATIDRNAFDAGGQSWTFEEPFATTRVRYDGEVLVLPNAWALVNPKDAFTRADRAECHVDLTLHAQGLGSVMGSDQDHIDMIFLPGQADFHYQHLVRSVGSIQVGDDRWEVNGLGGKDHSWGPRNWHAKIYLRWLIAMVDDDFGFMLVRGVGPTKQTRSGFVWDRGEFHLVDDFEMRNTYADAPNYELLRAEVGIHSGPRVWTAVATPGSWVPLRHRQPGADGHMKTLRIVKSQCDWAFGDGRTGAGMCEYHDLMEAGVPVGLND